MVAGKSPEQLPPGWKEYVKVKNGRKIKYYSNSENEKKFYSKMAVMRYVNMEADCNNTPLPLSMHVQEDSKSNTGSGVAETNASPAWLPPGWIVEEKPRKGTGSTYKIYIEPATGSKFYSKPQVSQYLETLNQSKDRIKQNKNTPVRKSSLEKDVTESQNPDKGQQCGSEARNNSNKHSNEIVCYDAVGSSSVDGLPVGWTVEFNTRHYARGIKRDPYYIDPVSGYAFRSKKDVLRYLETGDIKKCAIRPKKRDQHDSGSTKDVISNTIMDKSVVKKDASEGHMLKKGQKSESKTKRNNIRKHSDLVKNTFVDGLPPGWTKEIKTTRGASGIRKDPYYLDPVSGYMFRSKKDALRYIETGDINKCASRPKKRDANGAESNKGISCEDLCKTLNHTEDRRITNTTMDESILKKDAPENHESKKGQPSESKKEVVKSTSVDGLPPGWTKEIKTTRGPRGIRRDSFYLDPVSGYIFRSKKDALRYVETGDIPKRSKPKKRDVNDEESSKDIICTPAPVGERYSLRSSTRQLSIGEKLNDGISRENCKTSISKALEVESSKRKEGNNLAVEAVVAESITKVSAKKKPNRKERKSRRTSQSAQPEPKGSEQPNTELVDNMAVPRAGSNAIHEQNLRKDSKKQKVSRKTPTDSKKPNKRIIAQDSPGRASKRLAGCQPEMPANLQLSERSLRAAIRISCGGEADILPMIAMKQPFHSELASVTALQKTGEGEANTLPITDSNSVAEAIPEPLHAEPEPNVADIVTMVVESVSKVEVSEKSEAPFAEDQTVSVNKNGGQVIEKQVFENPKPQYAQGSYPFLDSWSDPCLDFAFKTLTGAIPVDDNLGYQGSSQHQLSTDYIQGNEYFEQKGAPRPDIPPNGMPSHSSAQLHGQVEQFPGSLPSSPPGHFSLPTFGNNDPQQHSENHQRI